MAAKKRIAENAALAAQNAAEAAWRDERAAVEHQRQADAYCASQGLSRRPDETKEQHVERMRQWCRERVKRGVFKRGREREPGEDDVDTLEIANQVATGQIGPEAER